MASISDATIWSITFDETRSVDYDRNSFIIQATERYEIWMEWEKNYLLCSIEQSRVAKIFNVPCLVLQISQVLLCYHRGGGKFIKCTIFFCNTEKWEMSLCRTRLTNSEKWVLVQAKRFYEILAFFARAKQLSDGMLSSAHIKINR